MADLHSIANHFAVEINPLRTKITELPEPLQPGWKLELRSAMVRPENQQDDLISFFSTAFENAAKYPGNNVLKYAVKHSAGFAISQGCWALCESFLLGSLVAEPSLAPTLSAILVEYSGNDYKVDKDKLREALAEIASYHARFRQGFEVSWALGISKLFGIVLPDVVWPGVCSVDDSVVTLLSLDLRDKGLANKITTEVWAQHMRPEHLYTENWLVAYEALEKGWLPSVDGRDYAAADDFFGLLSHHGVEFYDPSTVDAATETDWLAMYMGA